MLCGFYHNLKCGNFLCCDKEIVPSYYTKKVKNNAYRTNIYARTGQIHMQLLVASQMVSGTRRKRVTRLLWVRVWGGWHRAHRNMRLYCYTENINSSENARGRDIGHTMDSHMCCPPLLLETKASQGPRADRKPPYRFNHMARGLIHCTCL